MTKDKQFKLRQPKIDKDLGCEEISYDGEWITYGEIVDILNKRKEDLNKRVYDLTEEGKLIEKKTGKIYNIKVFSALSLCYELNYLTTKIQELARTVDENEQLKEENWELEQENEKLENRLWNCQNVR